MPSAGRVVKHLSWLVTLPVTIVAVAFAVANRGEVALGLWPLPGALTLPVYLIVLGTLALGFLLGWVVAWIAWAPRRRRARQTAERARQLARELAEERRRAAAERPVPADGQVAPSGDYRPAPQTEPARQTALEHLPGA